MYENRPEYPSPAGSDPTRGIVKMLHTYKQRIGTTEDPLAASTALLRFFIEKVLFVNLESECPILNRGFYLKILICQRVLGLYRFCFILEHCFNLILTFFLNFGYKI